MFNIAGFFKRIQNTHTKELFIRSIIGAAIKKYTSNEVPIESITFNSSTVILKNVSQSLKSAIFVKKQSILKEINSEQTIRIVSDIR
jgi:hypothetical protein